MYEMIRREFKILISYILVILLCGVVVVVRRAWNNHCDNCWVKDCSITMSEVDSLRWNGRVVFSFDPNLLDRDSFLLLGLDIGLVDRIVRYRNAKGFFKTKDAFFQFCKEDSLWCHHFEDFVSISKTERVKKVEINKVSYSKFCNALKTCTKKDINRLYYWREAHMGIVSWKQLYDLDLFPENFIKECSRVFYVDKEMVSCVDVNVASYEELRKLPYLSKQDIQSVLDYRADHMGFAVASEFFSCVQLSALRCYFLKQYLCF